MIELKSNLNTNVDIISSNIPLNYNFVKRELVIKNGVPCIVLYISTLVKQEYLESNVIYPLLFQVQSSIDSVVNKVEFVAKKFIVSSGIEITKDVNFIASELMHGQCAVLIGDEDKAIICNTAGPMHRSITESQVEKVIKGGKEAFIESLSVNIALIQQGIKNEHLKIDKYVFGEENKADGVLMYLDNAIDKQILQRIKDDLSSVKMPQVLGPGVVMQLVEKFPYSIFPQSKTTEKPTKAVSDILQGKAVLIVEGSPYVMIMPVVFMEFFQEVEDYGNRLLLANFDRAVRLLALVIILTLPSIYLILLKYNSELTPLNLSKIIIRSRLDIPLPPFVEILMMEIVVEVLREGGLRLPTPVGQTLSIIGGIILGQSATAAGIVSPTTLVVIAITVICTFVIPNYDMVLSIRLLRFAMLISTALLGILGLLIGIQLIVVRLMKMDSYGVPYLSPIAPLRFSGLKDTLIRTKIENLNTRAAGFKLNENKKKQ
ncbi:spore germination protein [Clostridium sp. HMP27]|uniref:spore germination protein n=1 Tax=Clostridium sp. HMP27 TaxID=1487921 RepID=UPI000689C7A8|nr:spore germination protein [Clostridium sp. HMP27]